MTCHQHSEAQAIAYCRSCGRGLCAECRKVAQGIIYCGEHAPAGGSEPAASVAGEAPQSPLTPVVNTSPGLAFFLGLIPGVGAIYNGQYVKGFVHAVIFGLMISLIESVHDGGTGGFLGILLGVFGFYMAFEAYHTAKRRKWGEPVQELSSLFNVKESSSVGAVLLIVLGVVFLLNTLEIVRIGQVLKFWPVLLIVLGANMLYNRISAASHGDPDGPGTQEVGHERQ